MAKLENKAATRGLPPPPAPTRRSANPWKYSDTARKRDPAPEAEPPSLQDILEDMQAAGDPHTAPRRHEPAPTAPPPAPAPSSYQPQQQTAKRSGGIWPLFILLIAAGVVIKVLSQAAETGEWRAVIAPIIAIAFIAHGWWRMRQRRDEKRRTGEDDED